MRTVTYRARTVDGRVLRGEIAAASAPAAARTLAAEGKIALAISERHDVRLPSVLRSRSRISAEEQIAFLHELTTLLGAGLPVHEALRRLVDGAAPNASYGRLVAALHAAVLRGVPLSQAMEIQKAFPQSIVGMVRAGEESGTLATILQEAATILMERNDMRESMRSALAYPLFLLAATALSLILMVMFVLPVFASLLRDLSATVPLPTQILLSLSDLLVEHAHQLPIVGLGICFVFAAILYVPSLRCRLDGLLLRLPILGAFLRFTAWQMILRTMAILLRSGIRLDAAVGLARMATENRALAVCLVRVEQCLVEGRTFAYAMEGVPFMPPLLHGMLAAGEEAGDLEHLLQYGADYCRRRAGAYAARMESLAEPAMIVLVAALIFFVVLSVLLPILDTMDALM